jgi:hypothetical protein
MQDIGEALQIDRLLCVTVTSSLIPEIMVLICLDCFNEQARSVGLLSTRQHTADGSQDIQQHFRARGRLDNWTKIAFFWNDG